MKKIKSIWLNDNNRLVFLTDTDEQYQIDTDIFLNPAYRKVPKESIDYSHELDPQVKEYEKTHSTGKTDGADGAGK